ncbi:methylated-DNA--protein-cysteine methyltransferase [Carassius gibelio]|uniref:methylated-DNA--protein-cysteine methyltransferase n=1 Tax=Carassius gibelio TaxID=101364 RepID=UPI002278F683|nr:methylated-DNA--protein-cysteine methyltransferase [Carassius gibelio]
MLDMEFVSYKSERMSESSLSPVGEILLSGCEKGGHTINITLGTEKDYNPKAVRAAGSAMKNNSVPLIVLRHRVLRSSGDSGSYMGGKGDDIKVWMLTCEKTHWSLMHQRVINPSDGPQNHFMLLLSLITNILIITFLISDCFDKLYTTLVNIPFVVIHITSIVKGIYWNFVFEFD